MQRDILQWLRLSNLHLPVFPFLPQEMSILQVYKPYLLMNKKRYAGLLWTNPDKFDKMDTKVSLPNIYRRCFVYCTQRR